ncbi:tetratricopeptide repeat protein [Nonomuraea sp. NPDC050691]|uniref:tetratricopeptide repeat protein n=1 Tax=Nonomuraea sp. NPDC050691 TaxID=3155661 RepID=UPI0033E0F63F
MTFGVLGPVQVRQTDGQQLSLSGKQRAVLATLLLHVNTTVSRDRLIAAVWDCAPASAVANIQSYIAWLRRALPATARLRTQGAGYLLEVAREEVDLLVFEDQVRLAKSETDPTKAAGRLQVALGLWRGSPAEDAPLTGAMTALLAQWEERLAQARLDWADTQLELGRHAEVIAELRRFAGEQPLHERFWQQLMLALSGAGRRGEALEVYQHARTVLADELGIEPGPELQRLQAAVLSGSVPSEVRKWRPAMCSLPADLAGFAGRDEEVATLTAVLRQGQAATPVVVISGPPGVGKSTLAVHVAHRVRPGFPDGRIFLRLTDPAGAPREPSELLAELLRELGVDGPAIPAGLEDRAELYRSLVAGRAILVVLDDAADALQVSPLLPGTPRSAALVTSRAPLTGLPGVTDVQLDAPAQAQAHAPPETASEAARAATVWHVARQLPLDVPGFTGRDEELVRLDEALTNVTQPTAVVISALSGTAGVGKTALALHWAHRRQHLFPDGQLYVNLRGFAPDSSAMSAAEALRGFLDALRPPVKQIPDGLEAQSALYRSLLAGRRVLIVLDNARDADQIRPLLPGTPGCPVVVTSRDRLPGLVAREGAYPLTLDLLTGAEARQLLISRLGQARVAAEPKAVEEIIDRCARLPLALTITAAHAAAHPDFPLAAVAAGLREDRSLDAFEGGDHATDVRAVFSWSYRCLSPEAARLFRMLSLHPGPDIAVAAAASLAGFPARQARRLLTELDRAHLIKEHLPGRYTFHDLLRAYAAELAGEQDDVRRRIFDHYLHTTDRAAQLIAPHQPRVSPAQARPGVIPEDLADARQATDWFAAEQSVLLTLIDKASLWGIDLPVWQLAERLIEYLDRQGRWRDQERSLHTALDSACRAHDKLGQAHAQRGLGWAYMRLGRYDDARVHMEHAVTLFAELGERIGEADAHRNLGWLGELQGDYQQALRHDLRSLELYQAAEYAAGQARALGNLGWTYARLGDHVQALSHCLRALRLHQETGNRRGEAAASDSIGFAYHQLGEHQQAIDFFHRALALYQALGDRYNEADTLVHLGDTHHAVGDIEAARETWQQALRIFDELGHSDAEHVRRKLAHQGR